LNEAVLLRLPASQPGTPTELLLMVLVVVMLMMLVMSAQGSGVCSRREIDKNRCQQREQEEFLHIDAGLISVSSGESKGLCMLN
jgi:hypothetical protein